MQGDERIQSAVAAGHTVEPCLPHREGVVGVRQDRVLGADRPLVRDHEHRAERPVEALPSCPDRQDLLPAPAFAASRLRLPTSGICSADAEAVQAPYQRPGQRSRSGCVRECVSAELPPERRHHGAWVVVRPRDVQRPSVAAEADRTTLLENAKMAARGFEVAVRSEA